MCLFFEMIHRSTNQNLTGVLFVVVSNASKYKLLKLGLWLLICIWFVGGHHSRLVTRCDTQGLVLKIKPAILPIPPNYYMSAINEQLGGKSLMDRPVGRASDNLRAGEGERAGTAASRATTSGVSVCDHGGS
jgi:hypothetical protein